MAKAIHRTKSIPAVIEAQVSTEVATVQIIRLDWRENTELLIAPLDHFQIDLCLSARLQGMSVCYPERWGALRFGRVGELMLIPPGEKVIARCAFPGGAGPDGAGNYTHASTVIKLAPALVHEWSDTGTVWAAERLESALDISDQSIYSLMSRVTREAMSALHARPTPASQKLVELIARQLGIEVSRYFESRNDLEFKGGLAAWRLRLIDERAQQVGKAPGISELAVLCTISSRQLQRGFRVSRGCSIGRHIEYCRIENAKRLLQQGEAIGSVAVTLGYASQSSFSYAFRRATGGTPAQFCQLI